MGISTHFAAEEKALHIDIAGKFDFTLLADFRNAYESCEEEVAKYVINLGEASYLDSVALGMLLTLYNHATSKNIKLDIVNLNGYARQVFESVNFDKLFNVAK